MEDKEQDKSSIGFREKIGNYLSNWDSNNTYRHKIIVISVAFLVMTSFLVYRLTTALTDSPMGIGIEVNSIDQQAKRMSAVNKTNDSIDMVMEQIETIKLERYRNYIEGQKEKDSLKTNREELINDIP
jgi:hypothetical protein